MVGGQALIAKQAWSDPLLSSTIAAFRVVVVILFGAGLLISLLVLLITQKRGFTAYKRIIDRFSTARSTQFNLNISFPEHDELGDLGKHLNRFLGELRKFDRIKVERMRASQQQAGYLAEALGKGMLVVNSENKITYTNSHLRTLFNLGEKSVAGLPVNTLFQSEQVLETLEQFKEKPKNQVLDNLKIKSGDVTYRAKAVLVPIINSEVNLVETMIIFEYVQKKMLQK
jgi:transcriptional regulator with PAS, ATPase and Fis domain